VAPDRSWNKITSLDLSLKKLAPYKEIFPALAKTDAIDARRILEPFRLRDDLAVARGVLQEIVGLTQEAERLKRFTRRRRQLVNEKVRVLNRMQADLQAVCSGLLAITAEADNPVHHPAGHRKSNQTEHAPADLISQLRRIRQPCNTEPEHQTTGNPANHATL
jgi:hypothetical protein